MSSIRLCDCAHNIEATDADLGDSRFNDVRLANSQFVQVTLEGSRFEEVSFVGVSIKNGVYSGMTIEGIDVEALLARWRAGAEAATA